jgi:hypothetical protein
MRTLIYSCVSHECLLFLLLGASQPVADLTRKWHAASDFKLFADLHVLALPA